MRNQTVARLLKYLARYRLQIILSLLLAIVNVVFTLHIPVIIGQIIDCCIGTGQVLMNDIIHLLTVILLETVAVAISQWLMSSINNRIVYNTVKNLRYDIFEHLQTMPLKYIDSHGYGEIVNKAINDVDQCADGLLLGFTQFFTGILTILGTLLFMLRISTRITLIVIVLTPVTLFLSRFISSRTYDLFKQQSSLRAEQTSHIEEMIGNQKIVQAFSQQDNTLKQFDDINNRLTDVSLKATFYSSLTNPSTRVINAIIYAILGLAGAFSVIHVNISVGSLSSFLSYANQFTKPFNEITGVITELQNAFACAARVFELLDEPTETSDKNDAIILERPQGKVVMKDVAFSYSDRPFITDMNIDIQPGQRVALVGPTGCGKTTLINLLMRFYDVNSGVITIDEHEITDITRKSLRSNFGMVLQDSWIRQGTIRENIMIGKPDATEEEIIAAARAAHAHSFIRRMPDGYDTVITEDGGSLSQGQKQLLCISRLMLSLPPLLILDEATSSIDTRTELKIQDSFARLMKGKTSFIVAHRLSTIKEADVILVMKDGKIIEKGNHDSLLENHGFYYDLYNSQFEH
ncbi:MAG: ABC transporter ATP-binding protein [Erysipelotrichaceae bacterium]|nr:ABC transporter ATP-binding protein [Erysipelotrichaceae bacterium]